VDGNRVLGRLFGSQTEDMTEELRKLDDEELHDLYFRILIKDDEIGGA
jgi:hypothetical protein